MRFGRLGQLKHGYNAMTTRESDMLMDIGYQEMDENEIVEFEDPLQETAFVITTGDVEIAWNGQKEIMHRESLLDENPYCLHVPHGVCCAILLPALLRRNLPACREKMEVLAGMLVQDSAEAMIAAIEELRRAVGLPENFSRYGLKEEHFDFIVKNCRSGSMKSNPRDFSDDEVRMILKELMG